MTPAQKASIAAAFLAIVGGIAGAVLVIKHPESDLSHVTIDWVDGGKPATIDCYELDGLSTPGSRAFFGLDPDGGSYAHLRIAVDHAADAGTVEAALPAGYLPVSTTEQQVTSGLCTHLFEAWMPSVAPFQCACAPALPDGGDNPGTCQMAQDGGRVTAPSRTHFAAGTWQGGCTPKPCGEIAGSSSWPTACGPESL